MATASDLQIPINVSDLRQFVYCPRVVYFTRFLGARRHVTAKMEQGKLTHQRVSDLEERRSLRSYGLTEGEREFNLYLKSDKLGLAGRIDMLVRTADESIPVDFKDTERTVGPHHKYQIAGYAMLLEECGYRQVRRGFIYLVPSKQAIEIAITPGMRHHVKVALSQIRKSLTTEQLPPPTPRRARCYDCEFRRFCNDVL